MCEKTTHYISTQIFPPHSYVESASEIKQGYSINTSNEFNLQQSKLHIYTQITWWSVQGSMDSKLKSRFNAFIDIQSSY